MDEFKLTGDTLKSVNKVVDEEEERLYAELYKELEETDRRVTRTRRRGRGQPTSSTTSRKGQGKGRGPARGRGRGRATYIRHGSSSRATAISEEDEPASSSEDLREPEYDDDGNLLSEGDCVFTTDTDENEDATDYFLASDHTSDDDSFTLSP